MLFCNSDYIYTPSHSPSGPCLLGIGWNSINTHVDHLPCSTPMLQNIPQFFRKQKRAIKSAACENHNRQKQSTMHHWRQRSQNKLYLTSYQPNKLSVTPKRETREFVFFLKRTVPSKETQLGWMTKSSKILGMGNSFG